jgi:class 3 adenylate cyclase
MPSVDGKAFSRGAPRGEHRQITAMFCDLVDSTELAEALDDEELSEVIHAYQGSCARAIVRFGGHIAQYLGDGILVYFGYPKAHEDDTERALRAALEIFEELRSLNDRLERDLGIALAARVGMHRGSVVVETVGDADQHETLAFGETINIAARLQSMAPPGAVTVSAATLLMVPGLFICEKMGPQHLKGIAESITAFRVLRRSGVQSRLDAAASSGLTPLVGREEELGLLLDRWQRAQKGLGQAVFLTGEAGIGCSRLARSLRERIAETAHTWLECRCSPYGEVSGLHPVIDLLRQRLAFKPDDSAEAKLAKLEQALAQSGFRAAETVPLFAPLLSLSYSPRFAAPHLSPDHLKWKTLEALSAWLQSLAEVQPVVLLVEDLQQADRSMLELLDLVLGAVPKSAILAVFTSRHRFIPAQESGPHLTRICMKRLDRGQVAKMLENLGRGRKFSGPAVQELVRRADGVPLFLEELVRMMIDLGHLTDRGGCYELSEPSPGHEIPAVLEDLLMARLDRLGPAKAFAQLCAPLGREFSHRLLQAVAPHDDTALRKALHQLLDEEILYQRGEAPESTYAFRHSLLQEVAYQSMLRAQRREIHCEAARALQERFPEIAESQPEVLAWHLTEAGRVSEAVIAKTGCVPSRPRSKDVK